ncbi:protein RIC-3b [Neosynchiropus ocellatus]
MAISTFQKVTLATCVVLCVALLLPKILLSRGRKDAAERPEGSGNFPPMVHRQMVPEGRGQRTPGFNRAHSAEAVTRGKGAGTGLGAAGKSNLAGQIIPVYGFGILLYILYILFKITSKGNSKPLECRSPPVGSENMKRKITDFELLQLQEKLRQTELMMENIVSNVQHSPDRVVGVMADQEESLLQQLTEITRVMREGKLVEAVMPEKELDNWEGYPEESGRTWEFPRCSCHHDAQPRSPPTDSLDEDSDHQVSDFTKTRNGEEEKEHTAAVVREQQGEQEVPKDIDESTPTELDLEVPTEDLLEELELELTLRYDEDSKKTDERMEDLKKVMESEAVCSSVRRRNKRRRAKRDCH